MSSGRDTLKHAAIYSGAAMFGKMVGFLMLPFYAHALQAEGYAVIGMLDMGLALLASLLAFGVRDAVVRLYHDEPDPARKPLVVSTGLLLVAGATTVLSLPLIIFARPISALLLKDADMSRLLVMALVAFILDLGGKGATAWLLIRSRSMLFATINIVRLFLGLGLNIWLIVIKGMGLDGFFISSMATALLASGWIMIIALRDCSATYDREIAARIRSFMLPMVPGALVSFFARQAERFLVRFLVSLESVGILEMAYKFPFLITQLITTPFMQSWNTRRFEMADQPGAPEAIGRMYTWFLFLTTFAGLLMAVTIEPLLALLTPPEFLPAHRIAKLEICTLILQGTFYHFQYGLLYAKRTGTISRISGWTSLVKIGLAWWFVSTWGINGAAFSAAIIALATAIITLMMSQPYYRLKLEWGKIALMIGGAAGLFVAIDGWDLAHNPAYLTLSGGWLPALADSWQGTFLGSWKDGKAVTLLREDAPLIARLVLSGGAALVFGVLFPFVHDESGRRLVSHGRRLLGGGTIPPNPPAGP